MTLRSLLRQRPLVTMPCHLVMNPALKAGPSRASLAPFRGRRIMTVDTLPSDAAARDSALNALRAMFGARLSTGQRHRAVREKYAIIAFFLCFSIMKN